VDFYDEPIGSSGSAGAAQTVSVNAGYYIDMSINDSPRGTVDTSPAPDPGA
jgi:hypothetical protein